MNGWLYSLEDNTYLNLGRETILQQKTGIAMGTHCAVFVANIVFFAYRYDFMVQLSNANQVDFISKFSGTVCYTDNLFCIDNHLISNY